MPPTSPSDADTLLASALLGIRSASSSDHQDEIHDRVHKLLSAQDYSNSRAQAARSSFPSDSLSLLISSSGGLPSAFSSVSRREYVSPQPVTFRHTLIGSASNHPNSSGLLLPNSSAQALALFRSASTNDREMIQPSPETGGQCDLTSCASQEFSRNAGTFEDESSCKNWDSAIRKEQVEAALRSKPQRGRKRDNLTDRERLELTRTRNREHARSTRNRKKARYQELVEKEATLDSLQQQKILDIQRRHMVVDFLAVRENMIHSVSQPEEYTKYTESFVDIVENIDEFQFEEGELVNDEETWIDQMKKFDENLAHRISNHFCAETIQLLTYSVVPESVALSLNNRALVVVDLCLQDQPSAKLLTAHLEFTFVPNSAKIQLVVWHTIKDSFEDVPVDGLCGQTSYPSVVSLDPAVETVTSSKTADESHPMKKPFDEKDGGPGMNI